MTFITFLPLLGGLILLALPGSRPLWHRAVAFATAFLTFLGTLWLWSGFNPSEAGYQFVEKAAWIPALGIQYFLGVDGLSLPMIVLTAFLTLLAILYSFSITERSREFFFFLLMLETAMLGVFGALDLFLFYVFWEMTLIPMYFLIGIWGGAQREKAAIKFFLFTLVGSVLMLGALLALYFTATPHTLDLTVLASQVDGWPRGIQIWIFAGLFLGFAVKVPIVPFHTWLPLAHVEAPAPVSMILAGVLLKMGAYGLMRFSMTLMPTLSHDLAYPLAILAAVNIVYGALVSMSQTDLKRMIAYSSINHMGYVLLGVASMNLFGFTGAVFQMVSHGLIAGMLFLLIGVLYDRTHTREISAFGGLATPMPVYSGLMALACFASMGLPLLAGFVGEFLSFVGAAHVEQFRWVVAVSLLGILFTAVFLLNLIRRVFLGPTVLRWNDLKDMTPRELMAVIPLAVMIFVLGVYPNLLIRPISPALTALVEWVTTRQP